MNASVDVLTRKAALAGAIVLGSVAVTVVGVAVLFRAEGQQAANSVGHQLGDNGPFADRIYRRHLGNPVQLLIAGDSVAGSLGASTPKQTLGARLSKGLADHINRAVELHTVAVVGAETHMVNEQLDGLPEDYLPDIAVIIVGANDLTKRIPTHESVAQLRALVKRLRAQGAEVVVGTCPDFDTLPAIPQPLRTFGGQRSRHLAAAQFRGVLAAGGRPVRLGTAVRRSFLADPVDMFARDAFHPSGRGYRRAAKAMLPAVIDAYDLAGAIQERQEHVQHRRGRD